MKKYLILILAVIGFPVLSHAAAIAPWGVTVNTDIDAAAEQISNSGPTSCSSLTVCNVTLDGDVVRIKQSATALTGTMGGVATTGWPLYPALTSGETCITIIPEKSQTLGTAIPINSRQIYAATESGSNTAVAMSCIRNDAKN